MVTSIAAICAEQGVGIEDTVYCGSRREVLSFQIVSGDFYAFGAKEAGKQILMYKNCLEICDFALLRGLLPQLAPVSYTKRDKMPYFTAGLAAMAEKIRCGGQVAVEGGPCLFGTDEVRVEVVRKDGRKDYFDYNTGKAYLESGEETADFREFATAHAREIKALRFENRKRGLTPQEWAFIKYPFEIAQALGAPLVIPIPDVSYAKYLDALLKDADEPVRREALEAFRAVSHSICDMHLAVIRRMQQLHNTVRCEVVHERDTQLCRKYYEARAPYMERNKVIRNLTGIPEKLESIKDYVSMPALPLYLYGISNVIEVDSMDEADSFRKCRKAHKGSLNLACVLFPELLSSDRIHTIFDAPLDRKEYGAYVVE